MEQKKKKKNVLLYISAVCFVIAQNASLLLMLSQPVLCTHVIVYCLKTSPWQAVEQE